ncbi:pfs domain-containing protein [Colletotrichum sojae]|uniref:Pfs domain-containing protein n=1 Tax=Colletotrichum sojae TaxID=2175907 RepID=A0A8H6IQ47_9PEZI|nr:pfs domain-containing protein [Colletotrichum sojae]
MALLLAKAYSATGHLRDAHNLLDAVFDVYSCGSSWFGSVGLVVKEQLAACEAQLGRHDVSLDLRRKVFTEYQGKDLDADTLSVAMMNLADSLWMTGDRNDALDMAQDALARRKRIMGTGDPRLLRNKRKVAEYLHGSNQRRLALQLPSKSALADSYHWNGEFQSAMDLRVEVYRARFRILGQDHPDLLLAEDRLLSTQSSNHPSMATKAQVKRERKQAVRAWERVLGPNHPYTLEGRVNLGHSYSAIGDKEKALCEQKAVLEVRNRHFKTLQEQKKAVGSAVNPLISSTTNVANLLEKKGDFPAAWHKRQDALEIAEGYADEQVVFKTRNYMANHFARQGGVLNYRKALLMRRSILKDQKRSFLTMTQAP